MIPGTVFGIVLNPIRAKFLIDFHQIVQLRNFKTMKNEILFFLVAVRLS